MVAKAHNVLFIPCFNDECIAPLFQHLISLERYGGLPKCGLAPRVSSERSADGTFTVYGAEELGAPAWRYPVSVLVYTTSKIRDEIVRHPVMLGKVPTWFVTRDGGTTQLDAFLDVFAFPYAETFTRVLFLTVNCMWFRPVAPLWRLCLPDTVTAMEVGRESFSPTLFLCPHSPTMVELFRTAKADATHPVHAHMAFANQALRRRCVSLGQLSKHVLYNLPRPSHLHTHSGWTVLCGM